MTQTIERPPITVSPSHGEKPVIIVGGGLAGLAAACVLAARGRAVTLYEANDWVGGKAAVLEDRGFRFDMGPTILTMPTVLRRIFAEAGQNLDDHLQLVRLDPQWRCFFEDRSVLDLKEDLVAMRQELSRFSPETNAADQYARFMELSKRLSDISDRFFFWRPIGSVRDMFDAKASFNLSTLRDVLTMRMGRSVGGTIRSFVKDPRVSQMLDHFTQYVGSAPDASPAVLCGIAHMQTGEGIWYPMGGTRAVPVALASLAERLGVQIVTSAGQPDRRRKSSRAGHRACRRNLRSGVGGRLEHGRGSHLPRADRRPHRAAV